MKQITEDYVFYETAVLLKEKGFDEICSYEWGVPDVDKGYVLQKWVIDNGQIKNSDLIDGAYTAPTQSLALKWLREVHRKHICVRMRDFPTQYEIEVYDTKTGYLCHADFERSFDSYEKAVESALDYVLKNLI